MAWRMRFTSHAQPAPAARCCKGAADLAAVLPPDRSAPAASPGALLPVRCAWPCLQRRRLLGARRFEPGNCADDGAGHGHGPRAYCRHWHMDANAAIHRRFSPALAAPHAPMHILCTYGGARSATRSAQIYRQRRRRAIAHKAKHQHRTKIISTNPASPRDHPASTTTVRRITYEPFGLVPGPPTQTYGLAGVKAALGLRGSICGPITEVPGAHQIGPR